MLCLSPSSAKAQELSPADAKAITSNAYLYGYAMLYNYKTMFQQAVDPSFPGYVGGYKFPELLARLHAG